MARKQKVYESMSYEMFLKTVIDNLVDADQHDVVAFYNKSLSDGTKYLYNDETDEVEIR